MRNIFLFIRRYFNFLFFLLIQAVALMFLVRYNRYHEALFLNTASEITGRFNTRYNAIDRYFNLRRTNDALARENAELRRMLNTNFEGSDTSSQIRMDSLYKDSALFTRRFEYFPAKVVSKSLFSQVNTIMVHRGRNQGIEPGMAVIGPDGVVGTVINVSANYADVMSMLHKYHRVSAMLKHTRETGTVRWDGEDPSYVTMERIPKSVLVKLGDSIVTSDLDGFDGTFPPGILVGTVAAINQEKASNFYTLKVKTATNFFTLQFVTLVKDLQKAERIQLADSTHKKVQ